MDENEFDEVEGKSRVEEWAARVQRLRALVLVFRTAPASGTVCRRVLGRLWQS